MNINTTTKSPRYMTMGRTAIFLLTFYPLSVYAADNNPFSLDASTGIEYDSNITVQAVDIKTSKGDTAGLIDLSTNYAFESSGATSFEVGYSFSQSLHQDLTAFDLQTHIGTALVKHKFDGFDVGLSYLYINTSLGGAGFLQMNKVSPYVAFFATPSLYVRANYAYTDKNLKTSNDRDAQTNSGGVSVFYFMNKSKTYLMFSYTYDSLNANADQFDYNGHDFKLRYQVKFPWSGRDARFRIGGHYVKRNYNAITPSIGAVRDDKRTSFETMLEVPFMDSWVARLKYRYTDSSSNLPSSDYKESLASFEVGFEF